MDLQYYNQDEISEILMDRLGIGLTKSTFMRYSQQGFIMMPKKQSYTRSSTRRVLYHSLVPVEIAASYLLFRGDWLKINSDVRMARAIDQDAFLGRLLFYRSLISDFFAGVKLPFTYDFADFATSVRYYISSEFYPDDTVAMDNERIGSFLDIYETNVLKTFLDSGIGPAYFKYVENLYRITFWHLYDDIFPGRRPIRLIRRSIAPPNIPIKPGTSPF